MSVHISASAFGRRPIATVEGRRRGRRPKPFTNCEVHLATSDAVRYENIAVLDNPIGERDGSDENFVRHESTFVQPVLVTCWAETRRAGPIGPRGLAEASHREKRSRLTAEAAIVAMRPRQAHGPCRARLTGRPTTSPCPSRKSRSLRTLQPSSAGRLARGRARDRNDADRSGGSCGCADLPRHRDGRVRIDEADWRLHDLAGC